MKYISRTFRKVHGIITFYDPIQKCETTTEADFYDKSDADIEKIIKSMDGIVVNFDKTEDTNETRFMSIDVFIENSKVKDEK